MVGDKLVVIRRSGLAHILTASPELELIGENSFAEDESLFSGTPAIAGNQMFIRSNKRLYCIAEKE
jgi:hypothetical protein